MSDSDIIDAIVGAVTPDHANHPALNAGKISDILAQVLQKLRAMGITWTKIFQVLATIIAMAASGASVQAIIQAILAIFFPPTPTPT